MRLYEIEDKRAAHNYAPIAEKLLNDCGPYLAAIKYELYNNALYRGFKGVGTDILQKFIMSPGRLPKDTPFEVHEAADEWFYMQFGVRYRSDALFATGAQDIAEDYGTVCSVFPIGDFKFCWSSVVQDMSPWLENHMHNMGNMSSQDPKMPAAVEKILNRSGYLDHNLPAAANSNHEVMIHCSSYYLVPITRHDPAVLNNIMDALDNL